MKKIFICSLVALSILGYSQKFSDLKFETNVPDAENHYVALPNNGGDVYNYGFIYFDDRIGYSFRSLGSFVNDNGKIKIINEGYFQRNSMFVSRIGNFNIKTAKFTRDIIKKLDLDFPPKWLENNENAKSEVEKELERASKLNAAKYPELALSKLMRLYNRNFKNETLYFELAFAYNSLKKYSEAEKISNEAFKNNKADDFVFKEYIFALIHQEKIKEADVFLTENISAFTSDNNKIESIINFIALSASNNKLLLAEKWLKELKSQPNSNRYQRNITQLENIIKDKQSKIQ